MWTITYINFSILTQGFLCLHLLSQHMESSKVSCFPNHRQAGHILLFWTTMRPLLKWFLSKLCLSLAFSQESILHTWNFIQKHTAASIFRQADCFLASIQVPTRALANNSSLQRWQILELSSIPETHILTILHCTGEVSKAIPVSLSEFMFVNSFSFLFLFLLRNSHPIARCLWTNHF